MTERNQCDLPTYYLYESDNGWRRTNNEITKMLNRITIKRNIVITHEYYPQWPEPEFKSQTRPAWKITTDGVRVVRCYSRRVEHKKTHGSLCRKLNGNECACTCAITLQWDDKSKLWVQSPLIDKI